MSMLKKHTALTPAARPTSASSSTTAAATATPAAASATTTTSAAAASAWVTPGDLLGSTADYLPGFGTYVLAGQTSIYAGVVGMKCITKSDAIGSRPLLSLSHARQPSRLPVVGDVVTCRVTKINARLASVEIMCLHSHNAVAPSEEAAAAVSAGVPATAAASATASPSGAALSSNAGETYLLDESLSGTIRQRDVRAFDIDSVEISKSFRPCDLVRAQVLSLGDARSYFLSTARNDLGVIMANSPAGAPMIPINWEQMQCPLTQVKEYRKVAKIDA